MQADVTAGAGRLLTVKEVAARLRTSTAMVYTLCARGSLGHVRISTNAIRVPEGELSLFIGRRLVPR